MSDPEPIEDDVEVEETSVLGLLLLAGDGYFAPEDMPATQRANALAILGALLNVAAAAGFAKSGRLCALFATGRFDSEEAMGLACEALGPCAPERVFRALAELGIEVQGKEGKDHV
jgi:hypothetical protein